MNTLRVETESCSNETKEKFTEFSFLTVRCVCCVRGHYCPRWGFFYVVIGVRYCVMIIISHPLSARVVGAPKMILQPVFSIFPCSPLPSGTCRTPGLSIPWCCLPTSSSACRVFFPISLCLCKMVLARPDEWETWPYHFCVSTTVRRSSCGPIAYWILAQTSLL